jgi:acyl-CoA synthetase (AMP-forming)/AMP-acid ligase II
MTYGEIDAAASALAQHLLTRGLPRGGRVAIYLGNIPESVIAMYATWKAGGCIVPFGTVTPVDRFVKQVLHCGAEIVVSSAAKAHPIVSNITASGSSPRFIWAGETPPGGPGTSFINATLPSGDRSPTPAPSLHASDLAAIIYTSGSSGTPKGVVHTHGSFDAALESIIEYLDNNPDDVILSVLQTTFSYGLLQLLATFRTHATLVLESGFGYPYEVIKQFNRYHVTGFAGTPTIWAMLLQLKDLTPAAFVTIRYITNAAAAMPPPFVPRLAALFTNARIFLMHGMTEVFRTAFLPPDEALDNPASIGLPMRGVLLWLEDDQGNKVAPGGVGELVIGGPTLMREYWNDPEGTRRILHQSKHSEHLAIHSGDLFRIDERGYFYFVARKDDVIKSRGEKVSPVEVEGVIYQLQDVQECRVVGIPDDLLGNRIRAEIVVREGKMLEGKLIKAHCIRHLEPYKVPQEIIFVSALPKTAGGKIVRRTIDSSV